MRLLSFDPSTEFLSLALWHDGEVRVRECMAGQKHSELVLPLAGELLAEAGWKLAELDGIVFGQGPGSFTGLRIGCGVAQGLAFGAEPARDRREHAGSAGPAGRRAPRDRLPRCAP